jgi:hypothetical protein
MRSDEDRMDETIASFKRNIQTRKESLEKLERFPLEEKYLYLKDLGHSDEELKEFQERSVRGFWRQLK